MGNQKDAHEIIPGIFLGNKNAAHNIRFLKSNRILLIVNCTKDVPFQTSIKTIEHFQVPVDDKLAHEDSEKLLFLMPMILQKILAAHYNRSNVLIHCYAGMQRSATVVACLLMFMHRMTATEAIQYIQSIRPIAFTPSANFRYTLQEFDKEVRHT